MALPQPDPSLPGGAAPVFGDTDAARGDHLRANNQAIWENLEYLNDGENINDAAAATPVDADKVGFFQIAGAIIKYVTFANFFAYIVSKLIAVATKTTPVDADAVLLRDSEASDAPKWFSFTNLKAFLLTYFDTKYPIYTAPASVTPTFTGFGTVSAVIAYTWRVGAYLHFEYTWTNGTVTATEARASLRYNPGSGEVDVTSASTYPTLQIVGNGASSVSPGADAGPTAGGTGNGNTIILAESSKTYITFGAQIDGVIFGLTKRNGDVFANSAVMSIRGAVRIQGW